MKSLSYKEVRKKIQEVLAIERVIESCGEAIINHKTKCPFHNDTNPSLQLYTDTNSCYCFACKKGGDAVNYLMAKLNLSYDNAINHAAKLAGINVDFKEFSTKTSPFEPYYDLYKRIIDYCKRSLLKDNLALAYLKERGISNEEIEYFNIGLLNDAKLLLDYLLICGHDLEDIRTLGIYSNIDRKQSNFEKRIIFPIYDRHNNPIALNARTYLHGDDRPKYYHSGDSIVYKKSEHLYNLNKAVRNAHDNNKIFIVEGVFDVIAMYKVGYLNTVAALGTSINNHHLDLIKRSTTNIYLFFDNDNAGKKALEDLAHLAIKQKLDVNIIINNDEKDAADLLLIKGKEYLNNLIKNNSINYIDYKINNLIKESNFTNDYNSKQQFKTALIKFLDNLNPYNKQFFLNKYLNYHKQLNVNNFKAKKFDVKLVDGFKKAQRSIIRQITLDYQGFEYFITKLDYLIENDLNALLFEIRRYYKQNKNFDEHFFQASISNKNILKLYGEIVKEFKDFTKYDQKLLDNNIKVVINNLDIKKYKKQRSNINSYDEEIYSKLYDERRRIKINV